MCLTGASGTGKTQLILSMLTKDPRNYNDVETFYPKYNNVVYFYRFWQPVYDVFLQRLSSGVIKFVKGVTADALDKVIDDANPTQSTMLVFDDSCEEILQSASFANLATAGRHKGLHVIFIKHNMYQQGKYSVTIDKNTTHIILMKSPRIGKQLKILGQELDNASPSFLLSCYKKATMNPFGHLLIDLTPDCNEFLRYCSRVTGSKEDNEPTTFYLLESLSSDVDGIEHDIRTNTVYTHALQGI